MVAWAGAHGAGTGAGAGATRTFRFSYAVAVRHIPAGARRVSIWVPVPQSDSHQQVLDVLVRSPLHYSFTREQRYGNRVLHVAAAAPLPDSIDLKLEVVVARQAYRVLGTETRSRADAPTLKDLGPDALVPIDGEIAAAARQATANAHTPLEKARAIYDYVTLSMHYDKSGEGWGRGDAIRACDVRRGNCTDFHSLIIGMARSCGIPARFVIGFPLPEHQSEGVIPGYHCWAEMYVEGVGGCRSTVPRPAGTRRSATCSSAVSTPTGWRSRAAATSRSIRRRPSASTSWSIPAWKWMARSLPEWR